MNRRKHERQVLTELIPLEVSIDSYKGKKSHSPAITTYIKDISAGGLRLISLYPYPKHPSVILNLTTTLAGNVFNLKGAIAWDVVIAKDAYEYGIQFFIDEYTQMQLEKAIETVVATQTNGEGLTDMEFIHVLREIENAKREASISKE